MKINFGKCNVYYSQPQDKAWVRVGGWVGRWYINTPIMRRVEWNGDDADERIDDLLDRVWIGPRVRAD
ncbi:unnamed protein product [marine sediment metagenome]|uniref:Uncharacterized protein n=1 Tax=marine sediment metagenome TaxID=412755 RepID=X0W986_9ZZZZ